MKVYLDNCCYQRLLDSRTQIRVSLEAEAVSSLLLLWQEEKLQLIASDVLLFEVTANPNPQRKTFVLEILARIKTHIKLSSEIEKRAQELEMGGFKGLDALHLAFAEAAAVDYFCTTDDRLLNRAKSNSYLKIKVVSPVQLAEEVEE